ncbi:MAG: cupin domain-containing protein [Burkholderiales bacterium]|nr:cupin domain-containing protein [Burkholderiales bacterium]
MSPPPRYPGPLPLAEAKSRLVLTPLEDSRFHREGPRANVEYRDLGLAEASGGRISARHIRAIQPFGAETGWHWHDMTAHIVYVLKGWIEFRFDGIAESVTVAAGACLSQPAGVAHNVVGQSDDLELIEINMPADFVTLEMPSPGGRGATPAR